MTWGWRWIIFFFSRLPFFFLEHSGKIWWLGKGSIRLRLACLLLSFFSWLDSPPTSKKAGREEGIEYHTGREI
ncbi:hypothetical protein L873DRAFT_1808855 [Choiromyces venosus 120613-1]|uniref:Uncharacterized protein n=1 Tax=Choiromyces venosus 120613-1 TaxID=1336337 RepID=A0A3N4JL62_9PEZI|nr:hypothetical protein L873DRAFT_1808855 [Choiromyces venosus 120613-1]